MLQASNLSALGRVRHGFLTRAGGVSRGAFEALNCGYSSGDDPARVERNRALALALLGAPAGSLCTVRQVHGAEVLVAREPEPGRPSRQADALVSDRPGVTLGVLSADCAPVLLADPVALVIGAAHAGWRGALAGVLEATVQAMAQLGARPERICAAVGPCIGQPSYEVGPDLQQPVQADDPASASLFRPVAGSDRLLFDLEGYARRRLARAGVEHCQGLGADTLADEARFFSARRTRKAGGERFGLLLSAIALTG
jgi:purine-nucleoside/S-methyl-5'-thioadenosine phosphorylase / adenosine deaminase